MALSSRDLDDLKPMVNETVKTFMGFSDPTLVITVLNCLGQGYDKRKTVGELNIIVVREMPKLVARLESGLFYTNRTIRSIIF